MQPALVPNCCRWNRESGLHHFCTRYLAETTCSEERIQTLVESLAKELQSPSACLLLKNGASAGPKKIFSWSQDDKPLHSPAQYSTHKDIYDAQNHATGTLALDPHQPETAYTRGLLSLLEQCLSALEHTHLSQNDQLLRNAAFYEIGKNCGKLVHELGNVVNWLNGHIFLVKKNLESQKSALSPSVSASFEAIDQASIRLTDLLKNNRLLTQDGLSPPPKPEPVSIKAAIDSLAASLGFQRVLQVHTAGIPASLELNIDRTAFVQIAFNLLTNAADAVADLPIKSITAEINDIPSSIELRISNNGPVIPETHQQKIFEPLFTTKHTGSGLGLAICRTLAEKNGWLLRLDTTALRTTFVLSLPRQATLLKY